MPFTPLKTLQEKIPIQTIEQAFSRFSCKRDMDIESFLKNRAIQFEELAKSRTYFFIDQSAAENREIEIWGFFSIAPQILHLPEGLSIRARKELDGFSGKIHGEKISVLPVMLIGQIAKNDQYENVITGRALLAHTLTVAQSVHEMIGGRIVMVDVKSDAKGLIRFYEENGFVLISEDPETGLSQMIYMLC